MREIRMTQNTKLKNETIDQLETHLHSLDVMKDSKLSQEEDKTNALNTWEQDVRRLLTASNKGMPGSEEGLD